jgi:hypothetical protein
MVSLADSRGTHSMRRPIRVNGFFEFASPIPERHRQRIFLPNVSSVPGYGAIVPCTLRSKVCFAYGG